MAVRKNQGFTLMEMLVVLVILSMTTALLTQGLASTWQNFEKLSTRQLMTSSSFLPISWFQKSVAGGVLLHPEQVVVTGTAKQFSFISTQTPTDPQHRALPIVWKIEGESGQWFLDVETPYMSKPIQLVSFSTEPVFEYLHEGNWTNEFAQIAGRFPRAVRITQGQEVWALATIQRPFQADVPIEYAEFGEYEF